MATDQEIRDAGFKYISQQKYLQNPFKLPVAPVGAPEGNQPFTPIPGGITNTDAFNNSGNNFNPTGNMFGEGTAVNPVYGGNPITGGFDGGYGVDPVTGDLPGGGNIVDEFGTEGEVYSKGAFDSLKGEDKKNFLSKMRTSFNKKTENLPDWAKKGLTAAGMITSPAVTLLGKIFGGGSGGEGGSYGIAGLTDQQKGLYNSLASQGMLYNDQGIMKTFDGKNFSQVDEKTYDNYFDNKIDRFGSLEAYENYINEIDPKTGLPVTSRKNLRNVYDYNQKGYTGLTGNKDIDIARQKQSDAILKNEKLVREIRKNQNKGNDTNTTTGGSDYRNTSNIRGDVTGAEYATTAAKNKAATQQAIADMYRGHQGGGGGGGGGVGGGGGGDNNSPDGGGSYCFDPSTPIQMSNGSTKEIKNIQLGDATKGGEVTGVFQFKASDEIHDYKGVTVAGSHYVKEDGRFIMVKDSPLSVKVDKIPVVYSLDTSGRRIFIKDIEFADYNGDGVAKNFLTNEGVNLSGFDKEVLRQVENRLI